MGVWVREWEGRFRRTSDRESGQRNREEGSSEKLMHSETCPPGDR